MAKADLTHAKEIQVQLYTPHPGQRQLHNSKARFRVMPAGRRVGKTTACCNEMIKFACEHPNMTTAWCSPTYRQSRIAYRLIKKALYAILTHTSDSELRLELPNGSVMLFCSSDNYDALRGLAIHFLVVDECATVAEAAWLEVLRPCLADTRGKAVFIGTPKGHNWFYQLYLRGLDSLYPDWESFSLPTSSSPYVPPEEIEIARRELPEMVFLQEFEAHFLSDSAGVFRGIDACVQGELLPPTPDGRYIIGWDPAKYQDYSVITVLNAATKHVDWWDRSNQVDYTVQIERVAALSERYNRAPILMDMTGVGDPLLEQLKQRRLIADGYLFNNTSKKALIEELVIGIEHQRCTFPDLPVLIGELRTMEYTLTPSRLIQYSAPTGAHDDAVISLALSFHAASLGTSGSALLAELKERQAAKQGVREARAAKNDWYW